MNKVMLIGNVGADPEIRKLNSGASVANLRVATSERWRDKQTGEKKERTEWHTVVIFNDNLCEIVEKYVHKGDKIFIEGKLQTRKWQDRDGNDRYSTEVILQGFDGKIEMLGSPNGRREGADDGRQANQRDSYSDRRRGNDQDSRSRPAQQDLDDEIPF